MKNIIKLAAGILSLPLLIAYAQEFFKQLLNQSNISYQLAFLLAGIVLYFFFHFLVAKFMFLYVFGHELIHALAALLCGAKVYSFKATRSGGAVRTSKTNVFIELAPYFVPIYTLLLIFLMPLVRHFLSYSHLVYIYILLIGVSLGFHLLMNAESLKTTQSDITKSGYIFSLVLISLANLFIIFFIFGIFSKGFNVKDYLIGGFDMAWGIYSFLWHKLVMK